VAVLETNVSREPGGQCYPQKEGKKKITQDQFDCLTRRNRGGGVGRLEQVKEKEDIKLYEGGLRGLRRKELSQTRCNGEYKDKGSKAHQGEMGYGNKFVGIKETIRPGGEQSLYKGANSKRVEGWSIKSRSLGGECVGIKGTR